MPLAKLRINLQTLAVFLIILRFPHLFLIASLLMGTADEYYIEPRLDADKIIFRYSERPLKEGFIKFFIPRLTKKYIHNHVRNRKKNIHVLGASAYTSWDFKKMFGSYPDNFDTMGITAENVAEKYGISRERQDAFACESHRRAAEAIRAGKFKDEIIPVMAKRPKKNENGAPGWETFVFDTDECVRPDTTMEGLAKLKPLFRMGGSVTAGNSSQMNDAAAFVVLMEEEFAREQGLTPIARFVSFAVRGVHPGYMGIGPTEAIPRALDIAGMTLKDIELIELNEAFASQSLACIDILGLDPEIVNVNGGGIAFGHPLGCTGAYLTIKLIGELRRRGLERGLVSMCIGGGMGAAGIFELI